MLWFALAFADPTVGDAPVVAPVASLAVDAEPARLHVLTISVKSPPSGSEVEATVFGRTQELADPGVGVHSATFRAVAARFTRVQLTVRENGIHTPVYDGLVPLSDAGEDDLAFVVTGGPRPTALRTIYAPSAAVRRWTEPLSMVRYGWGAILALYAAVLLIAATRRA